MVKEVNKEHKNVEMTRKKKRSKKDEKQDNTGFRIPQAAGAADADRSAV